MVDNTSPPKKWSKEIKKQIKGECSPMVRETGIKSQVESFQTLLKNGTWYLLA